MSQMTDAKVLKNIYSANMIIFAVPGEQLPPSRRLIVEIYAEKK